MSLWHIAWGYLWNRKLTTVLTIISVALAAGLISSVLTLRNETRERFEAEGQAFDLVVGAKGSPLQLVLSSVYFMDNPTGNISYELFEQIRDDEEYVEAAFPVALGDSYRGFRVVGTDRELFRHRWVNPISGEERAPFELLDGELFDAPMEAVVGYAAASQVGLEVGDSFISTHGIMEIPEELQEYDHSETPYKVVGILEASSSPFDRAIYTPLDSVWTAHGGHAYGEEGGAHDEAEDAQAQEGPGHDEEEHEAHGEEEDPLDRAPEDMVTAVLVQLQSPGYRWQYKELIRETTNAMAASPIEEIKKLYDQFLAPVKTVLLAVGYLVVVISALSILIGLYLSILQRKRDLAIMRALGASSFEIFGAILIEAFWVTLLGIAAGWLAGSAVSYGLGVYLAREYGLVINAFSLSTDQLAAFGVVALIGLIAGVLPAYQAYYTDVAHDLAEH